MNLSESIFQLRRFFCMATAVILFLPHLSAQPNGQPGSKESLPSDPMTRVDTLDNGFTYYIRRNTDPANKVEMRLVVRAGLEQEDSDQLQYAHLIEHLPISGTEHFNNPRDYFEKFGVRWGADLTGYTSWDATLYNVTIPSNNDSLLTAGLLFMRDCAQGINFEANHVDQEKHAVLEEIRQGYGYESTISEEYMPKVARYPKYSTWTSDKMLKSIANYDRGGLLRYYKDWYRPNLQGVIIVGDINVDTLEAKIITMFKALRNPDQQRKRKEVIIPLTGKSQIIRITHKEFPGISMNMIMKKKLTLLRTTDDYKNSVVAELYNDMMQHRFARSMNRYNPPVSNAGSRFYTDAGWLYNKFDVLKTYGEIRADSFQSGFITLYTELERVKRFGFFEHELRRAKEVFFSHYTLDDKTKSKNLVDVYYRHFAKRETAPDPNVEYSLVAQLVNGLTLTEVNGIAKKWITEKDRDIIIISGEKEKSIIPDDKTLLSWISLIKTSHLKPIDKSTTRTLSINLARAQPDTSGLRTSHNKELDVTTVALKNGIKIILKPMAPSDSNNKIVMEGFSHGGASQSNDNYTTATFASDIVINSGVGGLNKFELKDFLFDKDVEVAPYIDEYRHGLKGSCSPRDFEIMMQLIYAYFFHPNTNKDAFIDWKVTKKYALENAFRDQNNVLPTIENQQLQLAAGRNPTTPEDLEKINLEHAIATFKGYFASGCVFTFVFSGNFDLKTVINISSLYLGALPGSGVYCQHDNSPENVTSIQGDLSKNVHAGLDDKASVRLLFFNNYKYNFANNIKMDVLGKILHIKLTERLREKEKGVYGAKAWTSYAKTPHGNCKLGVIFDCAPENVARLIAATMEEIENLRSQGPDPDDIQKVVEQERTVFQNQLANRNFWLKYMVTQYFNGEDPNELLRRSSAINALTQTDLKEMAHEYFNKQNCIRLVRFPEKSPAAHE